MKNWWKETDKPAKTALANFSAQFFLLCMGTGVLAVNLQTLPYQFKGLGIISIVVWIFDLILFTTACTLFFSRWIMFPSSTLELFEAEPEQTCYLSTVSISASTLIEMTALVLGKTWQGWDTVLFWCDVALSIVAALIPYWIMFRLEQVKVHNLSPTALYPATAILSVASCGSVVVTYSTLSDRACQPVFVTSIVLLGFGFFIGLAIIVTYTARLLISHTPSPKKAMASFIPIAALSNTGYAADSLGRLAGPSRNLLSEYARGYVALSGVGTAFYAIGVVTALVMLGFATYWMFLSFLVLLDDIRDAPFSLNYWSALYPIGIYAIALGKLAEDFDSPTFRVLNTIMTIILLLGWLFCIAMTIPRVINGELLLEDAEEIKHKRESWRDRKRIRSRSPQSQSDRPGDEEQGEEL